MTAADEGSVKVGASVKRKVGESIKMEGSVKDKVASVEGNQEMVVLCKYGGPKDRKDYNDEAGHAWVGYRNFFLQFI